MKNIQTAFFITLLFGIITNGKAQTLEKDYSFVMEIPSVITISSSSAHFYVLSDEEGLAVFRAYEDSLQWLYTSPNMERRGHTITTDIRFAYLFGDSNRLTVLEPTSVMGVYSATYLPAQSLDAERIEQDLFVALGNEGLGRLSLSTPAAVDSTLKIVAQPPLNGSNIVALESSSSQLFVLSDENRLFKFNYNRGDLSLTREMDLQEPIKGIYLTENTLYGSDKSGSIYEISGFGSLSKLGNIGEPVTKIEKWKDWLIIKGSSGRLWTSYQSHEPELWKENGDAGNYFTVSGNDLWLSEYNHISQITTSEPQVSTADVIKSQTLITDSFSLMEIPNQTLPHTKPLLFPIKINGRIAAENIQFSYQSPDIKSAEVRGQSFYWQPGYDDVGIHRVKIIGTTSSGKTDSTSFTVNVRSFNAPPRIAPVRPISIPVGEEFSLPIKAIDPDGMNPNLIRFLGVNLPYGSSIDEQTGTFTWTPTLRQMGENHFRVIATDQYGAATSVDVTINVIENPRKDL
ncbi:MAG TPA: Ig domain-containing protein [Balneolaceae bacterium]